MRSTTQPGGVLCGYLILFVERLDERGDLMNSTIKVGSDQVIDKALAATGIGADNVFYSLILVVIIMKLQK